MAATLKMKTTSGSVAVGTSNKHSRECIVFNATSQTEAIATILADTTNFPPSYSVTAGGVTYNFVRGTAGADPADSQDNPTTWEGWMDYVIEGQVGGSYQTGDTVTGFKIASQQVNRKYSRNTMGIFGNGVDPMPDFGGLINVTRDSIDGVSVDVPTFTWYETVYKPNSEVTQAYINTIYAISNNPINDDTFRGIEGGAVRFEGMSGTRRGRGGDWELTFEFSASPNVTDLTVGNDTVGKIEGIDKKGWEYLWFYYSPKGVTVGSVPFVLQLPVSGHVEEIYGYSDFAGLGIGTT
jgi:hypothetical protein